MSDLYRLVYASRNLLVKTEPEAAEAVAQILAASQRNNVRVGVTGALLFNGGAFAQVLEGPRRSVEDTFERIQRDLRHSDVTVLQCGPVEARGFANWSMAFVGQSARGRSLWSRLAAESGFDHTRLDGDAVFQMLHGLVLEEEGHETDAAPAPILVAPAPAGPEPRAEVSEPESAGQPGPRRSSRAATEAALAVFRVALASERALTTELRAALVELQAEAATFRGQIETLRDERNLWAERFRQLAATLCAEAEALGEPHRDDAEPAAEVVPLRGAA